MSLGRVHFMFGVTTLASVVVSMVATGPVSSWPVVNPDDNRFVVRMPGVASQSLEDIETDVAKVERRVYTCSGNQTLWQLSTVDLAREMLLGVSPADVLSTAMESSRQNAKDELVVERAGFRDGAPFRIFRVMPRVGPVVSNMLVLDGNRLYHLQVVSRPDKFRQVGTRSFFDSFSLVR